MAEPRTSDTQTVFSNSRDSESSDRVVSCLSPKQGGVSSACCMCRFQGRMADLYDAWSSHGTCRLIRHLGFSPTRYIGLSKNFDMMILHATITCPYCGFQKTETMPTDACQVYYECQSCKTSLQPKTGNCCVFCSFGETPCPPIQQVPSEY